MMTEPLGTNRLEAFSDGVIAVIITIMVLELKVPHGSSPEILLRLTPVFLSYVLSLVVIAILWVNHHHLLHITERATGRILWLNMHFLFWLSLIPFSTGFMGENHLAPLAVAVYGFNMAASGAAYDLLRDAISEQHSEHALLAAMHRRARRKNWLSVALYGAAVPLAYVSIWVSVLIFVLIPALYFMPGRTIEKLSGGNTA
jgi:uncharacterized membrane protein